MKRAFLPVTLLLLISTESMGQCVNPPTVSLSSLSGSTCGTTTVTISGNTFGGSASSVTIKASGKGTIDPASTAKTPFDFTYKPSTGDIGTNVLITITTNRPKDPACAAATITYTLSVSAYPSAPLIGNIIQPTCTVLTGSIDLNGLPETGPWSITRNPGGVLTTGSGKTTTLSGLTSGNYIFTVTNSAGCTSIASANAVVNDVPPVPVAPIIGKIANPTCSLSTGTVELSGLPAYGSWTITQTPGGLKNSGSGSTSSISGLASGTYTFTVTNSTGCTSAASANVIIQSQPVTPAPPLIGVITQPGSAEQTGSVVLNGLPVDGTWTLTITPGNLTSSGSGVTKTISGLSVGIYSFTVTNSSGCTSVHSSSFEIMVSASAPELVITNPVPVCAPKTIDLTSPSITAGSTPNLSFTYWVNSSATVLYSTPSFASDGTYYIKGTGTNGLYTVKPVTVLVYPVPVANPGPDQILTNVSVTTMNAQLLNKFETGYWSLISGSGEILDITNPKSTVNGLSKGKNIFSWTVSNGVCPASSKNVMINVRDHELQTLITPNMDGKNDFFIIKGSDNSDKIELVIFDRRGVEVYKNNNYDDSWNGVDFNGRPLADDTYFYLVKAGNDVPPIKGYIVVRR